ncbi:hypothetical protein, partial [Azospirillum sp. A39]|uniref:hypothetical protein n=1 Tax=Azospirillum sp. A39 TaxID=3462279 RepID=UPI0040468666
MNITAARPPAGGLFANLAIRSKIFLGFGTILALLIGLGTASWLATQESEESLTGYTAQSEIALLSAESDAALLRARLAVVRFYTLRTGTDVEAFRAAMAEFERHVGAAKARIISAENRAAADRILEQARQYAAGFDRLVALCGEADRLTGAVINELGAEIRGMLTAANEAEAAARSLDPLILASRLNGQFLLARTVAARFLVGRKPDDRQEVADTLAALRKNLDALRGMPLAAGQPERLAQVADKLPVYAGGFEKLAGMTLEISELISGPLSALGRALSEESAAIRSRAAEIQAKHAADAWENVRDAEARTLLLSS